MATRVLVVDDSPTIRRVVSGVLERHGFEVVLAEDGQIAFDELLSSTRGGNGTGAKPLIDLALVDFVMPRMNGYQLCRAIRQNEHLNLLPIILMSAKSERIREQFVQQTGAIDAIGKPFDSRALIAVIENAVRRTEQWRSRVVPAAIEFLDDLDVVDDVGPNSVEGQSEVSLGGDLSVIPAGAVLQLLQLEAQTGTLIATDGKIEVTLAMSKGLIDLVQAHGAGSEFRLGRYFVEQGWVSPEDIERMLQERPAAPDTEPAASNTAQPPGGDAADGRSASATVPSTAGHKRIGDLLVDSRRVTREQLREALTRQSSELVYELLRWPRGRFEFRRGPPGVGPAGEGAEAGEALGLPVASVVMEGFRRVDEWRLVEGGLGSFDSVLIPDAAAIRTAGVDRLPRAEQKLLEMVDGERSVRDIVQHSHMSSFDACKILFQLLEARLVRRAT